MKDVNKMILLGRLGAEPVRRLTKAGKPVVQLYISTTRRFFKEDSTDSKESTTRFEETQWHRVIVWGKQADTCSQQLEKGNVVYVEGFLKTYPYSDRTGNMRTSLEIHAETISFLGPSYSKKDQETASDSGLKVAS